MRRPRLKAPAGHAVAYYHCVSRVVGREFLLGGGEKERLMGLMRLYERLYGLRVLAYCIMSNHFHILVEVPRRPPAEELPDDAALVARVRSCLGDKIASDLAWELAHFREIGADEAAEAVRERWFSRMWNVSTYMKVLKQRFSQWFNGRHKRRGTLWEDRFRSVLVEGKGAALRAMAAYIDLNPVRAKLCEDPKDYRWCGYAEAVSGGKLAREAVRILAATDPNGGSRGLSGARESLRAWRCVLFGIPEQEFRQAEEAAKQGRAEIFRRRVSREKCLEVLVQGGKLPQTEYLRCRVRYFTDGAVLGGKAFVESVFESCRDRFGEKRRTGARPLQGLAGDPEQERLFNLRRLQKEVFG